MNITVTPRAFDRIREIADGGVFRLAVEGGGCAGFRYEMGIENQAKADDFIAEDEHGTRVVVDPVSAELLGAAVLDWVEDLSGARFEVRNPNATSGCGCGMSFAV